MKFATYTLKDANPAFWDQINLIMNEFNFERVHGVMEYMNWQWHRDGRTRVPELQEIIDHAAKELCRASNMGKGFFSDCGGFRTEKNDSEFGELLTLSFVLESLDGIFG